MCGPQSIVKPEPPLVFSRDGHKPENGDSWWFVDTTRKMNDSWFVVVRAHFWHISLTAVAWSPCCRFFCHLGFSWWLGEVRVVVEKPDGGGMWLPLCIHTLPGKPQCWDAWKSSPLKKYNIQNPLAHMVIEGYGNCSHNCSDTKQGENLDVDFIF